MSFFGKLFGRKPQNESDPRVDVTVWKTGPAFVGAVLFSQFMRGDRVLVSDKEVQNIVNKTRAAYRDIVELWVDLYVVWLLRLLSSSVYGGEFARNVMAEAYGRIAANEDRLPGIEAVAEGMKYWFKVLDDAAQQAIKNPVKMKGEEVPPVYFIALAFMARDRSSPYANSTSAEFDGWDLEVAVALTEAQDISKARIDKLLQDAGRPPR